MEICCLVGVCSGCFDIFGVPISYESIGEPSPKNRAEVLVEALRASSLFGNHET